MREICVRWQDVRGDRLTFSCECQGDGCPDCPAIATKRPLNHAQTERAHGDGTTAQGSSAGDEEVKR